MKEQKWDDSVEERNPEIFELAATAVDEDEPAAETRASSRSHITELRRRIEERLDSKRIALEYEYDDLDELDDLGDLTESLQ